MKKLFHKVSNFISPLLRDAIEMIIFCIKMFSLDYRNFLVHKEKRLRPALESVRVWGALLLIMEVCSWIPRFGATSTLEYTASPMLFAAKFFFDSLALRKKNTTQL